MKVVKNGAWVDGTPYVNVGGAWVQGTACYVVKNGAWVAGDCGDPPQQCIDLPPAAETYLTPYTSSDEAAAEARSATAVHPRGPNMNFAYYAFSNSAQLIPGGKTGAQLVDDNSLTGAGLSYGSGGCRLDPNEPNYDNRWGSPTCSIDFPDWTTSNSFINYLRSTGLSWGYHIRPVPKFTSLTEAWERLREAFLDTSPNGGRATIERVIREHIRHAFSEGIDDVIEYWHLGIDDPDCIGGTTDHDYYAWAFDIIQQEDPTKRRIAYAGHKSDVKMQTIAVQGDYQELLSKQQYIDRNVTSHIIRMDPWKSQSPIANEIISDPTNFEGFWMMKHRNVLPVMMQKMVAGLPLGNHADTGLPVVTRIALSVFQDPMFTDGQYGAESAYSFWIPRMVKHDIWSLLASGSSGVEFYDYTRSYLGTITWQLQNETAMEQTKIITESGMGKALLWGQDKSPSEIVVNSGRVTCVTGWDSHPSPVAYNDADSFFFVNKQHNNKRFIILCNSHPGDTLNITIKDVGLEGLKITEIISGDVQTFAGDDLTVDIPKLEVRAYVVEPADGYCGGDEPSTQLPSVGAANSQSVNDGQQATFTASVNNATSMKWQVSTNGVDFSDVSSGGTTNTYSFDAALADDGNKYRLSATNINGTTYGDAGDLSVAAVPLGISALGQYWQINGVEKLIVGGFTGGEPHLYRQSDIVPADGSDTLTPELATLGTACGGVGGYIRCTLVNWFVPYLYGGNIQDFPFTGGLTTFDLTSINQQYFDRIDSLLTKAAAQGVNVSFELWETHALPSSGAWGWDGTVGNGDPDDGQDAISQYWNPKNNVTYTSATSGLPEAGGQANNDTFTAPARSGSYTVSQADETHPLLKAQKLFVDNVCTTIAAHDNAIVQMENESPEPKEWDIFWANYINHKGLGIIVTTMRNEWDLATADAQVAIDNPTIFDYADSSQGSYPDSTLDTKYGKLIGFHGSYGKPINSVKIYRRNSSYNYDSLRSVDNMMLNIMCGNAGVAFHPGVGEDLVNGTETAGIGLIDLAQRAIEGARWLDDQVTLSTMSPVGLTDPEWLNRGSSRVFAMQGASAYIFAYSSVNSGWFHFDFTAIAAGDVSITWFDLDVGGAAPQTTVRSQSVGSRVEMNTPSNTSNQWLAVVVSV